MYFFFFCLFHLSLVIAGMLESTDAGFTVWAVETFTALGHLRHMHTDKRAHKRINDRLHRESFDGTLTRLVALQNLAQPVLDSNPSGAVM